MNRDIMRVDIRYPFHALLPKASLVPALLISAIGVFAQQKPLPVPVPRSQLERAPLWAAPPKLIVGIVVDQMRTDYIYRYWDNFGPGGFKRLIGEGAFLRDAHFTYIPTVTGPGHASIYTGSVPAYHGIVANDRYDRATRKMVYCVRDSAVRGIGSESAQASPAQLLATTLADEIERRTDGKGHTIGIALKDRGSVLPIGRTGDAAYWYSGGGFATSSWYMDELPRWVVEFNARKLPEKYMDRKWEPLLPLEKYHLALPDANPYEQELAKGAGNAFPYDLSALAKDPLNRNLIAATPWGNTLTTDMALAALDAERLGGDAHTDLLAISYSSTDILGHKMGLRSLEVEDMYIRLDRELARLLDALDRSVGAGKYTVFLTADHGAVDVPAYLKELKGSAGYADPGEWTRSLRTKLAAELPDIAGNGRPVLDTIIDGEVFLNDAGDRRAQVEGIIRGFLEARPEVLRVLPREAITAGSGEDRMSGLLANGFLPKRCGDLLYVLAPGHFEATGTYSGKGTTHGSGWTYDTHVPVLFYGQGIARGEVLRRTAVADIVPTLCMIAGCAFPDAAVGEPVHEVIAR